MKLFGTSGIRGPADELFTNDFCRKIGHVFGIWLKTKNKTGLVALANDPRESSPRIKSQVTSGLNSAGWSVSDQGVIPTPALTYFVKTDPAIAGGIMVTGSHIRADMNGVKFFIDGEEITKVHEKEIENLFSHTTNVKKQMSDIQVIYSDQARESYYEMLRSLAVLPYPRWKVVLDTANGCQTDIVRRLLPELGLDTLCLGDCDIQSPFFRGLDTEKPSDYSELARQVLLSHADLGIGFDIDGDRVVIIDDRGKFIPGDISCTLLAKYQSSPVIVTPISSSSVVDTIGKQVFRTPVGSTYVAARMKEVGATFGFEANGGAISSSIHFGRDGGTTLIKMLNLLKKLNLSLSDALSQLPVSTLIRDKVDCPFVDYDQIYSAVKGRYSSHRIETLDGVKIWFANSEWLLFRGSGNAPEFRLFAESPDPKQAQKLFSEGMNLIKSVINRKSHFVNPSSPGDSLNLLPSIRAFPDQCQQVITEMSQQAVPASCNLAQNIVISGMGGSALGGRIITSLERQTLRIPVVVSTEYHLPNFVNDKSLVIISSYSGNTEETVCSLAEARARDAQIFILTSGGKLAEIANTLRLPSYVFSPRHNPSGQPRMGLGYNIMALITLLSRCQLIHPPKDLGQIPAFLRKQQSKFTELDQLAHSLVNRVPVLVASEHLKGAAHAAKNQFNENAKTFSVSFDLPEADHHLLEGLTYPESLSNLLSFVFLTSPHYHPEVKKRYPLTAEVIKKHHIPVHTLEFSAPSPLFEALELIQAGAYLAFTLSQIVGVDPGPIPWVNWMKDNLSTPLINEI